MIKSNKMQIIIIKKVST